MNVESRMLNIWIENQKPAKIIAIQGAFNWLLLAF